MTRVSTAARRGAASTALAPLLAGDARTGEVLAVFDSVTYLGLGHDLLAIEAADGLRLPCAVLLPVATADRPFTAVRVGDPVLVRADEVVAGPLTVELVRRWRPRRARTTDGYDAGSLRLLDSTLPPLAEEVSSAAADLQTALHAGSSDSRDLDVATRDMLGLGGGLTPEGDDVLVGMLVALRSRLRTREPAARLASAVIAQAPERTTLLSAALLQHAARGLAIKSLVDLVDELRPGGSAAAAPAAVVRLLAVGQTSGTALAHGVRAAAEVHATAPHRSEVA